MRSAASCVAIAQENCKFARPVQVLAVTALPVSQELAVGKMNYSVNVQSLRENFPPAFDVPELLLQFSDWLQTKPRGSVGYFALQSDRFNDYWIENGADLHPHFAFFIRDPTGGQIGYWLHDDRRNAPPPIVMVGSEGELEIISNTLEAFLKQLAERDTKVSDLDDRDEGTDEGPELTKWLKSRSVQPAQSAQECPDLKAWMNAWGESQRRLIDDNPAHVHIADKFRKCVKPNAERWETANFDVLLVGTQFKVWHRSFGPKPMPQDEVDQLEALFRTVREQRAHSLPERGLWFSAWVKVGPSGGAQLSCNFMDRPKILDEFPFISPDDHARDLKAFPRSRHWMPKWLEAAARDGAQ